MLYELLDQLRDELFEAALLQDWDNIARLERAIYTIEEQIKLEKCSNKEISA